MLQIIIKYMMTNMILFGMNMIAILKTILLALVAALSLYKLSSMYDKLQTFWKDLYEICIAPKT